LSAGDADGKRVEMVRVKCVLVGGVMGILSTLAGLAVAKADCSRDYEVQEHVVADYSYAEAFAHGRQGRYTECADEAEELACSNSEGMACAVEMQVLYSSCVAELVCDEWVQGALEDGTLDGSDDDVLGGVYASCVATVRRAGGRV
jgi:hypothetical protein